MQNSEEKISAIILAAGKGTRMNSSFPKVLHPVAGESVLARVIKTTKKAGIEEIRVVLGYAEKLVRQVVTPLSAKCFVQTEQLGTANAVQSADPSTLTGDVFILNGDHPLVLPQDLEWIMTKFKEKKLDMAVVSTISDHPGQLGRIVRHNDVLNAIVEAKDASVETLKIKEINTGIYLMKAEILNKYLNKIGNNNKQNEFYFTDIVSLAKLDQCAVDVIVAKPHVGFGVNTQLELAMATNSLYTRKNHQLMNQGVVLMDPATTFIEEDVQIGESTIIYPGNYIKGPTQIGSFCVIEPNCYISKCQIANSVHIKANSYFEESVIKSKAIVGPYARLRPETVVGEDARVGNFVELKKTILGDRSKANHLTYLGDAEIGEDTNIGCGTITCNYAVDRKKYKTEIGSHVFVGSDTQFVAPITVGDGAIIGSGSTITKDVPPGSLAIARGKQKNIENYNKDKGES